MEDSIGKFSESIKFTDNELYKTALNQNTEKLLPEITGIKLEENTNKTCNKLNLLTTAICLTYRKDKEWENKLSKLEGDIVKKVNRDELKEKVKKAKKKLNDSIEDQRIKTT